MSDNLTVALVAASDQCWESVRSARHHIPEMITAGLGESTGLRESLLRFACVEMLADTAWGRKMATTILTSMMCESLARELEAETV